MILQFLKYPALPVTIFTLQLHQGGDFNSGMPLLKHLNTIQFGVLRIRKEKA
ncbi:Uncharacterised protein [Vibrio cholerae]|nr:Uncharacterised protein [Vibrio cholerae]